MPRRPLQRRTHVITAVPPKQTSFLPENGSPVPSKESTSPSTSIPQDSNSTSTPQDSNSPPLVGLPIRPISLSIDTCQLILDVCDTALKASGIQALTNGLSTSVAQIMNEILPQVREHALRNSTPIPSGTPIPSKEIPPPPSPPRAPPTSSAAPLFS